MGCLRASRRFRREFCAVRFVLKGTVLTIFASLMKEAAVFVATNFTTEVRGTVLRRPKLRAKNSVTIEGAVDAVDTQCSILLACIGDIDADALVRCSGFGFAVNDLLNISVLTKVVGTA